MEIEPITLEGEFVRLEPLKIEHLDALCEVGMTDSLWFFTANVVQTVEDMQRYIETALDERERKFLCLLLRLIGRKIRLSVRRGLEILM